MQAVAYPRFSSSNQHEESITAQLRAIRAYAEKHGITIIREYIDEARSATTDDRPQFQAMINDILHERVKVDFVLVHKLDRFARNRIDAAIYKQKLQSKGVKLLAVEQPLTDSPEDSLLEGILESINEFYSKNLSREVKVKMKEYAYEGRFLGGTPLLGYDVENGFYVINPTEAPTAQLVLEMAAANETYGAIITETRQRGMKTKTGKSFGKNSIRSILDNYEKYMGIYMHNKSTSKDLDGKRNSHSYKSEEEIIRVPGGMPALIDEGTGRKIKMRLESRRHLAPRQHGDIIYLLTGKMFCGLCKAAYIGRSTPGGRNRTIYRLYQCVNKKQTKTCNNKDIRKEVIENAVLDELENAFNPENVDKLISMTQERYQKQLIKDAEEIKQIKINLSEIGQKMDRLFAGIESGDLASDVAGPRLNTLSKEKDILEARLVEIDAEKPNLLSREQILNYLIINKKILVDRENPENLPALKHIIDTYVKEIYIYPDDIKFRFKLPSEVSNVGGGGGS